MPRVVQPLPAPPKKLGPQFELGQMSMTAGVRAEIERDKSPLTAQFVANCLRRHAQGDWGDLTAGDKRLNDQGLDPAHPDRLVSAYLCNEQRGGHPRRECKIYIITEWDRSYTTILLPEEY